MGSKKSHSIGLRVEESLKETLAKIAGRETRSISQQVEHFVRQGIQEYLKNHSDFNTETLPGVEAKQATEQPSTTNA